MYEIIQSNRIAWKSQKIKNKNLYLQDVFIIIKKIKDWCSIEVFFECVLLRWNFDENSKKGYYNSNRITEL